MNKKNAKSEAGQRYAVAYEVHHTTMDLHVALVLYRDIATDHPDSKEAGYSLRQIHNIEKLLIPEQTLFDRQAEPARFSIEQSGPPK